MTEKTKSKSSKSSKKDRSRDGSKSKKKEKRSKKSKSDGDDKKSKGTTIEQKYKKVTHHEHILKLPDSYIGTTEVDQVDMFIYDEDEDKIYLETINYIAGFFKIFDEILVNARDHTVRDKTCKNIKITMDKKTGEISVWNDGEGIPVAMHAEFGKYVPEMIFAHLLTSENYDKKGKTVGGKNGYGSKVCPKKGTCVPLFSGNVKKVEDVNIGDELIGDDGTLRTVTAKETGYGKLFEIGQKDYYSYVVTGDHVLCLRMDSHKVIYWNNIKKEWNMEWLDKENMTIRKESVQVYSREQHTCAEDGLKKIEAIAKKISDDNILEISVKNYLKLSKMTQSKLSGYVGNCVQWEHKDVDFDPYVLGLWLGSNAESPLNKQLSAYNFENNKHIPREYIINSRDVRLEVLAGLIDSNGHVSRDGTQINITRGTDHEQLTKDIIFLSRSLGFKCRVKKTDRANKNEKPHGDETVNMNISGKDIDDIPTRIQRKQCSSSIKRDTSGNGELIIKPVESGEFVSLEIDGNKRFVLENFTVTHNCNIYSKRFDIHTIGREEADNPKAKKLEYKQTCRNNMYVIEEPVINKNIGSDSTTFTKITYLPDYEKFGMNGLSNDMYSLLMKRCYDVAACTPKHVKITVNGNEINCRDFKDYIKLYYKDQDDDGKTEKPKITHEKVNSRWEVGIGFSRSVGDRQVSFVNGISTFQGGTHVQHVINTVVKKVVASINSKKEFKDLVIQPSTIKNYLSFFINCVVEDPGFSSQTKDFMNSKMASWCTCKKKCKDVECNISDAFIEKLCSNGLMTEVIKMSQFKQERELGKTDGKKVGSLRDVDKLLDADWAGQRQSHKTSIFLTEGDSAKAFAVAGISIIGNQQYGVFPLRGKLLNVRNANAKKTAKNQEFINIKKILGLRQGVKYKDVSKLRYGAIIILTDQDPDGSHIKGLIINMMEYFWPELLQITGFIKAYNTPIVKAWKRSDKKKKNIKQFYTMTDFTKWKEVEDKKDEEKRKQRKKDKGSDKSEKKTKIDDDGKDEDNEEVESKSHKSSWCHKYYKGLGTSTEKEAKESFRNFDDNLVTFFWEKPEKKKKKTKSDSKSDTESDSDDDVNENGINHKQEVEKMKLEWKKKKIAADGNTGKGKKGKKGKKGAAKKEETKEETKAESKSESDSDSDESKDSKGSKGSKESKSSNEKKSKEKKSKEKSKKKKDSDEEMEDDDDVQTFEYMRSKSHIAFAKAFGKELVLLRKKWLRNFDRNNMIEYKPGVKVAFSEFIDKDLIFFSNMDNDRSIPALMDGLKPSHRMIMFACFKRGRRSEEIKVAQLGGYVSENTAYHHGEKSLHDAIVGLAQNFPGSNNINLLKPNGNFGYRRQGGKDHADARYIFTELDPITFKLFREEDDSILNYNYDNQKMIEPDTYYPILPIVLVNGAAGIGTGFSTGILPHNPKDIVTNLKKMLDDKEPFEMLPWFNGFNGTVEKNPKGNNKYIISGKYSIDGDKVRIVDIPINNGWIEPYEEYLKSMESVAKDDGKKIDTIRKNLGNNNLDITLTFRGQELQKMYKNRTLEKFLKMKQNTSMTNLHLFNADGKLTRYESTLDIMREFYKCRLGIYEKRREYIIAKLKNDLDIYKYRVKFIKAYIADEIKIQRKSVDEVIKQLEDAEYPRLAHAHNAPSSDRSYKYLTDMSLLSLTTNKLAELERQSKICKMRYDEYLNTTAKDIWRKELDEFLAAYKVWRSEWEDENDYNDKIDPKKKDGGRGDKKRKRRTKKSKKDGDKEDDENDSDDDKNKNKKKKSDDDDGGNSGSDNEEKKDKKKSKSTKDDDDDGKEKKRSKSRSTKDKDDGGDKKRSKSKSKKSSKDGKDKLVRKKSKTKNKDKKKEKSKSKNKEKSKSKSKRSKKKD